VCLVIERMVLHLYSRGALVGVFSLYSVGNLENREKPPILGPGLMQRGKVLAGRKKSK
jgi:hypothetical protein